VNPGKLISPNPGQHLKDPGLEKRLFTTRAMTAFWLVLAAIALLSLRYGYLQIISYDEFSTQSTSNRVSIVAVTPNRGLIYDRRGRPVAQNLPAYRLELVPEKVPDLEKTILALGNIIEFPMDVLEKFQRARKQHRVFDSVPLKFNLTEEEIARFAVDRHYFPGVEIVPYLARYYPYGELFAHALGYVGRLGKSDLRRVAAGNYRGTSYIGKVGIESYYEDELHGVSGIEKIETNAQGRRLRVLDRQDPVHGNDLILSLDVLVQQAAWDALGERVGAVVAMDPNDGSILALVSKPAFDANAFVHSISGPDYRAILNAPGRPLFNRALQGGYVPGSTMKPFIALAGLELGVVTPEKRLFSTGTFFLPGVERPYHDWKPDGHGWVNMLSALEQSANTYFYQLALDIGIDNMHDYLSHFGFGDRTGLDLLGENPGILPSRQWKRGQFGLPWYPGETIIAGIGQGFNVTTPVQLVTALATLVNGGTRFAPRMLFASKSAGDGQAQRIKAPVAEQIPVHAPGKWEIEREGMRRVVHGQKGTAREIRPDSGYQIAGKSGTAQVVAQEEGEKQNAQQTALRLRHHALFIAYAPFAAPEIVVAVVVEHGGGGSTEAAPVARAVIDSWLNQVAVR